MHLYDQTSLVISLSTDQSSVNQIPCNDERQTQKEKSNYFRQTALASDPKQIFSKALLQLGNLCNSMAAGLISITTCGVKLVISRMNRNFGSNIGFPNYGFGNNQRSGGGQTVTDQSLRSIFYILFLS